jgi:hypothetical protein
MKLFLNKFKKAILNYYPLAVIFLLVLVLFTQNYKPGTFLIGWDNLTPEFNPWVNIQ